MGIPDWKCPFCGLRAELPSERIQEMIASPPTACAQGPSAFRLLLMVCPNQDCQAMSATMHLYPYEQDARGAMRIANRPSKSWKIVPQSNAKQLPEYVPERIVKEYYDACAVLEINPNVAATLARRCMQAIVRDFYAVQKNTLADELDALKDKLDPAVWEAIEGTRKTGSIGKNMQKGVNLVFDSDPGEPELLLNLIEILFEESYIARHVRKQRIDAMRGRTSLKPGA